MSPTAPLLGHGTPMRVQPGTAVFREGDQAAAVYELVSGCVRIEVTTPTGARLVLGVKGPGDLVGELGALDGRPRSATAIAIDDVELLRTGVDDFLAALAREPDLAIGLLRHLSRDLRRSDQRTTARASADTTQRLALLLLELSDRFGEHNTGGVEIDLSLTQEDIAGWIGATREATARSLRRLREAGCVSTARRRVSVTDLDALHAMALHRS